MNNKVIIAAAGSEKTRHIVAEAILQASVGNVLITTFTDKNVEEIKSRIVSKCGCIPPNITVQPWFSFLLQHGVRPYQSAVYPNKRIGNLTLIPGQSTKGIKEENFRYYYLNSEGKIYSDKLAKLSCRINEKTDGLVISRLSSIYSYIFIDEVQDMAGYDLDFIELLIRSNITTLLVGDHRQGTFTTNKFNKHKQYRQERIDTYFKELYNQGLIEYDDTTLSTNHRCVQSICDLANSIYPEYTECSSGNNSTNEHMGLFLVKKEDVDSYIDKYHPVQLRHDVRTVVSNRGPVYNFGLAKGQTFDRVLIYPTDSIVQWFIKGAALSPETRSKLYVAVTRARYSVAFVYTPKSKDIGRFALFGEYEDTYAENSLF